MHNCDSFIALIILSVTFAVLQAVIAAFLLLLPPSLTPGFTRGWIHFSICLTHRMFVLIAAAFVLSLGVCFPLIVMS